MVRAQVPCSEAQGAESTEVLFCVREGFDNVVLCHLSWSYWLISDGTSGEICACQMPSKGPVSRQAHGASKVQLCLLVEGQAGQSEGCSSSNLGPTGRSWCCALFMLNTGPSCCRPRCAAPSQKRTSHDGNKICEDRNEYGLTTGTVTGHSSVASNGQLLPAMVQPLLLLLLAPTRHSCTVLKLDGHLNSSTQGVSGLACRVRSIGCLSSRAGSSSFR